MTDSDGSTYISLRTRAGIREYGKTVTTRHASLNERGDARLCEDAQPALVWLIAFSSERGIGAAGARQGRQLSPWLEEASSLPGQERMASRRTASAWSSTRCSPHTWWTRSARRRRNEPSPCEAQRTASSA